MQFPVFLRLHRSRFVDRGIVAAAVLAALGLGLASIPWPVRLVGALLWLAGVWQAWRCRQPETLVLRLDREGTLTLGEGPSAQPMRLLPGTLVHPWLTVVQVAAPEGAPGGRQTWVVAPDSLPAQDFRRLRVWLKSGLGFSSPDDGEV